MSAKTQAHGTASGTATGNFAVQAMTPDGHAVNAQGTYNPNTTSWNSIPATITYTEPNDLVGKQPITGTIGPTTFTLTSTAPSGNKVTISGPVSPPVVPTTDVNGTVNWVMTF